MFFGVDKFGSGIWCLQLSKGVGWIHVTQAIYIVVAVNGQHAALLQVTYAVELHHSDLSGHGLFGAGVCLNDGSFSVS